MDVFFGDLSVPEEESSLSVLRSPSFFLDWVGMKGSREHMVTV